MNEILSFNQRYREEKLKSMRLDHRVPQVTEDYGSLLQRREEFAVFCRDEGLSAITNTEQFDRKKTEISQKIETLPLDEAAGVLENLQKRALVGKRLLQEVNLYQRAKAKAGKAPEQLTDQELQGLGDQLELPSPWGSVENAQGTLRDHEDGVAPLALERSGQKGKYPEDKASFALHKETLIVQELQSSLSEKFHSEIAERLDLNSSRYKYFLRQTGSIDGLIKRFTEIPEPLADLEEKGLMEFDISFSRWSSPSFAPSEKATLAARAAIMLLPDGSKNKEYQKYLRARSSRIFRKSETEPDERWHQMRKQMYSNLIEDFSQINNFAHPDMEEQARKLAVYLLAATEKPVNRPYKNDYELWKVKQKPLAESVITLKRLGYEEGLEQAPLIEEMRKRIVAEGKDKQEIIDTLQEVSKKVGEQKRRYRRFNEISLWDLGGNHTTDWFVRETFCKVSTLDENGKYTPLEFPLGVARDAVTVVKSPEVVQDIIDGLRGTPS